MRQHHRWIAAIALTGALLSGCAHTSKGPASEAVPDLAALSTARLAIEQRDWSSARSALSGVKPGDLGHEGALFLGACVALEEGDFARAQALAAQLAKFGHRSETRMLGSLSASRRDGVGWIDAMAHAWNDAGSPDLQDSELLNLQVQGELEPRPLEALAAQAEDAEDRALLALVAREEWSERIAAEALPQITEPGVAYAVLTELAGEDSTVDREILRASAASLSDRHPESMQFALAAVLIGRPPEAPLTGDELAAIEQASRLPLARTDHLPAHYARAHRLFSSAGLPLAAPRAFEAAVGGLGNPASGLLGLTQAEELSAADRARLGESLWRIGVAFSRLPTLMEALTGNALAQRGAELLKDERRRDEACRANEELRALVAVTAPIHLPAWPLPSLRDEHLSASIENELDVMRRWAGDRGTADDLTEARAACAARAIGDRQAAAR